MIVLTVVLLVINSSSIEWFLDQLENSKISELEAVYRWEILLTPYSLTVSNTPITAIAGDLAHIHYREEVRVSGLLLEPGLRTVAVAATIQDDDAWKFAFTYR